MDAAKPSIVKSAQGLFSGSGGLMSIFQKGFSGVASIAQKAIGGLGSIFGNISTTLGGTKLFSGIAGIFKGIGTTVKAAIGTAGGTGVAGTIAAAVSHIPVIGTILLGGTLAVGAIGGGSFTNGLAKIGSTIGKAVTGIGKTLGKIVKSIGKTITKAISGIGKFLFGGTSSDGTKKRGVLGTIVHVVTAPIRWLFGKRAKGDKSIKKSGTYNVDEEGEEIIVRSPEKGRLTQLEKGDGVIPAKQTATLMGIAKNPIGWVKNVVSKIPSSRNSAASSGYTTITSAPQARKNTAIDSKVDEVVSCIQETSQESFPRTLIRERTNRTLQTILQTRNSTVLSRPIQIAKHVSKFSQRINQCLKLGDDIRNISCSLDRLHIGDNRGHKSIVVTFHLCKSHGFELGSIFQFLLIVVPACANKVSGFLNLIFELIQPVDFFLFLVLTALAAEVTLSVTNCTCISLPLVTILAIDASSLIGLCFCESILGFLQFNRTLLSIILLI